MIAVIKIINQACKSIEILKLYPNREGESDILNSPFMDLNRPESYIWIPPQNPAVNCLQNSSHPGKIETYCAKRVDWLCVALTNIQLKQIIKRILFRHAIYSRTFRKLWKAACGFGIWVVSDKISEKLKFGHFSIYHQFDNKKNKAYLNGSTVQKIHSGLTPVDPVYYDHLILVSIIP